MRPSSRGGQERCTYLVLALKSLRLQKGGRLREGQERFVFFRSHSFGVFLFPFSPYMPGSRGNWRCQPCDRPRGELGALRISGSGGEELTAADTNACHRLSSRRRAEANAYIPGSRVNGHTSAMWPSLRGPGAVCISGSGREEPPAAEERPSS